MRTKQDLRAKRRHALNGWLATHFLFLDEYQFWPQENKDAEGLAFDGFDATYEAEKDALEEALKALDAAELAAYFLDIGWESVGETVTEQVDDYLERA